MDRWNAALPFHDFLSVIRICGGEQFAAFTRSARPASRVKKKGTELGD
jgi:hypothetical protein